MTLTKNNICVLIKNKRQLIEVKLLLKKFGESTDEHSFFLTEDSRDNDLQYFSSIGKWGLSRSTSEKRITLEELEIILQEESTKQNKNIEMNKKFADRLNEFLQSECSDYGLTYTWEYSEDYECAVAIIKNDDSRQLTKEVHFKYNEEEDDLLMELCEDCWETTREFDWTVKYFWMFISPELFKEY